MSLVFCILSTWIVVIIFSLIPKKLLEIDMLILYFTNIIFELSIFTILHINLKWIDVSHSIEKSMADLVIRIIMVPLTILITSNILLYTWKILKWIIVIVIILTFPVMQKLLEMLGVIKTIHWNIGYTLIMCISYIIFSWLVTWIVVKIGEKEVEKI